MNCPNMEFLVGGFILGVFLSFILFMGLIADIDLVDRKIKSDCEQSLPRNQYCKYVAVPIEKDQK